MSQEQTVIIRTNSQIPGISYKVQVNNKMLPTSWPKPIIVKKENSTVLNEESSSQLIKNLKLGPIYKETLIFESKPGGFIGNSPVKVSIVNHFDVLRKITKTVITYYDQLNGTVLSVKTSERIARFMGQSNYETVLNAICSIKEEEIKVNAIMALLTNEVLKDRSAQTDNEEPELKPNLTSIKLEKSLEEKFCQTEENCMDLIYKFKQKKRVKRSVLTPYVVQDVPPRVIKKCVINISKGNKQKQNCSDEAKPIQFVNVSDCENVTSSGIPVLTSLTELNDNESVGPVSCNASLCGDEFLLPDRIYQNIDLHTAKESTMMTLMNTQKHYIKIPNDKGADTIEVSVKPEFPFHMATEDILKTLNNEDKVKLINYQAFLDYKWCLVKDSDGYLPIHNAVRNNDVDLLRRQCVVLRYRQESVDITASNNLTALQISIYHDTPRCTAMLIQHGADPLLTDEEHRTSLHLASESSLDNLRAVIKNCESCAREILQDHEDLWKPEYETKTKEELAAILLRHMCEMHDNEGYTPLMISAKIGNYSAVKTLLDACPVNVNQRMPNSGCTALFLAIESACHDATNRSNKSKVADNFYQTILILLQNGADNNVSNYSGTTISDLLADSGNAELSALLANEVTSSKFFANNMPKTFDNYMLLKEENGVIRPEELKKIKSDSDKKVKKLIMNVKDNIKDTETKVTIATAIKIKKEKPIILENIPIEQSPNKVFIDSRILSTTPAIKIGPNDMLVTNKNKKSSTNVTQTPTNIQLKSNKSEAEIVEAIRLTNLKNAEISARIAEQKAALVASLEKDDVKQQKETKKRKSTASGPSVKKTKGNKTT